jgi:5-(carboxyamino)imidazole ribonucleotide synthase
MFTHAAQRMGYEVVVLDPDPLSPAGRIASRHLKASYTDRQALITLGSVAQVVTLEFENVPAEALGFLRRRCPVRPGPEAVEVTQDRIVEKTFVRAQGLDTAAFAPILGEADIPAAAAEIAGPAILKTARLGYDGKGQAAVQGPVEVLEAFRAVEGQPCILEERVALQREISVVLSRGSTGDLVTLPVAENRHVNGILDSSVVPARIPETVARQAREAAERLAAAMGFVGTMAVEFFVTTGDRLLVNELAPRPHNSGHYTLDACATDQFEQQVRAVTDLPLGDATLLFPVTMVNLLGDLWAGGTPRWDEALRDPRVHLHLYGKTEPRPGRKMGHLNVFAPTPDEALTAALEARARLISPT